MYVVPEAAPEVEIDLPGDGKLILKPWASAAVVAGQAATRACLLAGGSSADGSVAFTAGVAVWAVKRWLGVVDANDQPLDLTDDLVEQMVVQDPVVFSRIDRQYVLPGLAKEAEKNGSALSHGGAGPAGATTKNSARPGAAGTTAAPVTGKSAKPAPRSKAPAKPPRARRSGTSS